jgi:hypothetical protein
LYYDANFLAANFVLEDETRIRISLNYENANNRKNPLRIFQCEFYTFLLSLNSVLLMLPLLTLEVDAHVIVPLLLFGCELEERVDSGQTCLETSQDKMNIHLFFWIFRISMICKSEYKNCDTILNVVPPK